MYLIFEYLDLWRFSFIENFYIQPPSGDCRAELCNGPKQGLGTVFPYRARAVLGLPAYIYTLSLSLFIWKHFEISCLERFEFSTRTEYRGEAGGKKSLSSFIELSRCYIKLMIFYIGSHEFISCIVGLPW